MWENIDRGWETIGGKTNFYRSKWEKNYALYLQKLKENGDIKNWTYEPQPYYEFPIKHGTTRYLPDFRVDNMDDSFYLVEIKGYSQGLIKLKRMHKYYPKIRIELVDSKGYGDLKRKLGKALRFY